MRGTTVELTHEEYRTVWHTLGLGIRHWNLDLPGLPELTEHERRAQTGDIFDGLRTRGLADRRGLAPDVADSLRLLANPVREINGWVQTGRLRCGYSPGPGVTGQCWRCSTSNGCWFAPARPATLCTAVARQRPDRPAGAGSSVSVPSALLTQPTQDGGPGLTGQQLENRLVRGGVKPADARSFAAMVRGPKPGGGKFGASPAVTLNRHPGPCPAGAP